MQCHFSSSLFILSHSEATGSSSPPFPGETSTGMRDATRRTWASITGGQISVTRSQTSVTTLQTSATSAQMCAQTSALASVTSAHTQTSVTGDHAQASPLLERKMKCVLGTCSSQHSVQWVQCSQCRGWYHCSCVNITARRARLASFDFVLLMSG